MGCSSHFTKELITTKQLLRARCMSGTALHAFRSYFNVTLKTVLWVKFHLPFYFVVKETKALKGFSSVEDTRHYCTALLP